MSFGWIFVAEMGDKSQLLALAFATRYRPVAVLLGITLATAIVHLLSVVVGGVVGAALPTAAVNVVAGLAFFAFAVWTLRGDRLDTDEVHRPPRRLGSAVLAVAAAFFVAELGDKTMLATVTLAAREGLFGTWLGSTLGMVAADALAIVAGIVLGARLPERVIRIGAAALFAVFGAVLVVEGLRG